MPGSRDPFPDRRWRDDAEWEPQVTIRVSPRCRCWNVARDGHQLDCHSAAAQFWRLSAMMRLWWTGGVTGT